MITGSSMHIEDKSDKNGTERDPSIKWRGISQITHSESPEQKEFHDFISFFYDNSEFSPPDKIDAIIRKEALMLLKGKTPREKRSFTRYLYYVSAAAASLVIVSAFLLFAVPHEKQRKTFYNQQRATGFISPETAENEIHWKNIDLSKDIETLTKEIEFNNNTLKIIEIDDVMTDSNEQFINIKDWSNTN